LKNNQNAIVDDNWTWREINRDVKPINYNLFKGTQSKIKGYLDAMLNKSMEKEDVTVRHKNSIKRDPVFYNS